MPVSSAAAISEPVRLVGVFHPAGSIRVRLLGLDGRPARGMVELPSPFDRNGPPVSTDPNGEVLLEGLAVRKHQLQASLKPLALRPWRSAGHFPTMPLFETHSCSSREPKSM